MADLPMAQIPNFQLGATINPNAFSSSFSQVGGTLGNIISQAVQNRQTNQQIAQKQQLIQEQIQKDQMMQKLDQFGKLTDLYKNTHKSLRPKLWGTIAQKSNELLGTNFDAGIMPDSANDSIEAAHQEIQNLIEGKQTFGDTMKKLGMLATDLDEETRKALEVGKGFLEATPEGQQSKAQGTTGSFSFQGYDPNTKQPIFLNSKSPTLITQDGKPYKGVIQSKTDFDKTTEESRKIDSISTGLDSLESLLKKIPSGAKGGLEEVVTSIPGGNLIFKEAAQYEDQLPMIAVSLYRNATGDTRLSDDDARKRALPILPRLRDSDDVKKNKIDAIRKLLEKRKEGMSKGVFEVDWNPSTNKVGEKSSVNLSGNAQDVISKWEDK